MTQPGVYRMIRRRAVAAGIQTRVSCHTFRGTGITNYLKNGGKLEIAQKMAGHYVVCSVMWRVPGLDVGVVPGFKGLKTLTS